MLISTLFIKIHQIVHCSALFECDCGIICVSYSLIFVPGSWLLAFFLLFLLPTSLLISQSYLLTHYYRLPTSYLLPLKIPTDFAKAYPTAKFQVITPDNFQEFVAI